ncbi:DUF1800 domain-containing protein [Kamptonema cortianum]|nr:DUF1800 domain-containing protein [Geitlerinema splendidum]MDK3156313.1 DUF1800 domain-containing protein [Kamptonema cortianum]
MHNLNTPKDADAIEAKAEGGPISRRGILAMGASVAAAGLGGATANAQAMGQDIVGGFNSGFGTTINGSPKQITVIGRSNTYVGRNVHWKNPELMLLRRISYGPRKSDLDEITARGYSAYLEEQLNPNSINDSVCENVVAARWPRVNSTFAQLQADDHIVAFNDLYHAFQYRAVYSKRQLLRKMTEFWVDHFNIEYTKPDLPVVVHFYKDVLQANALGTFKNLLHQVANHGGMMMFLDNYMNSSTQINVNFARELLELYTVGVNGGYTEDDIYATARVFTGWGIAWGPQVGYRQMFAYDNAKHIPGTQTIMGQAFPQGGKLQGDAVLDWLSMHPKTIDFVCDKLCMWFLGALPSPTMRSQLRTAWNATGGDLKSILRVILARQTILFAAPKIKRPMHYLASIFRALNESVYEEWIWQWALANANQRMFFWPQPDGYPDRNDTWAAGMVARLNVLMMMCSVADTPGRWSTDRFKDAGSTLSGTLTAIEREAFCGEYPTPDKIELTRMMKGKTINQTNVVAAVANALGSPSFQVF